MGSLSEGYAKLLRDREFLLFTEEYRDYVFEQTPDLFLATTGEGAGIKSWQIRQTPDALRIYRQYRGSGEYGESGASSGSLSITDDKSLMPRLREVIHYRKTYLQ